MKFLKYLFFLLLIVAIGASVYVATLDGDYQVEDSRVINAPAQLIFNEVNELKSWEQWGPWQEDDPNIVMSFPEKTSGVGASYSWKGETAPDGSIKTIDVIPNKSIDQTIVFDTPLGKSQSDVYWTFEEVEGGTKVTWGMKGSQSFKDKAFWATQDSTYSQVIRPMFPRGLENLDELVKEKMASYNINVDGITQHGGGFFMYNTTAAAISDVGIKMAQMMPQVFSYMQENNIPMTGSPMTIYEQWDLTNGTTIFSSAIPTSTKVITPVGSPVLCGFMPSQKVVKTTLKGDYKNLQEAWAAANKYIVDNELEKDENAKDFEIYRTDPNTVPNPADWVTEIYIPIK